MTKENKVEAIFRALDAEPSYAFLYKKHHLLGHILFDRLHNAMYELKYYKITKEKLDQVTIQVKWSLIDFFLVSTDNQYESIYLLYIKLKSFSTHSM